MYYTTAYPSPIGVLTLACDGERLVGLWMEGQKYYGGSISESMMPKEDVPVLDDAKKWLERYFAGDKPSVADLPLAPIGSEFRQGVWSLLREIPYGEVVTYGDIAKKMAAKLGKSSLSSQAVGGAVGHNPISVSYTHLDVYKRQEKALLEQAGGFDETMRYAEDYNLWLRIACEEPIRVVGCLLYTSRCV